MTESDVPREATGPGPRLRKCRVVFPAKSMIPGIEGVPHAVDGTMDMASRMITIPTSPASAFSDIEVSAHQVLAICYYR
jgi:hypothetical protein